MRRGQIIKRTKIKRIKVKKGDDKEIGQDNEQRIERKDGEKGHEGL